MTRYLVGILFCFVMFLAYFVFRAEAFESLRHRKIRKRDIRQKQEGALNFWFYNELEKEYGLGKYGVLLRLYPVVAGTFTALHISFGWIEALAWLDLALATVTALYLSAIILAACMSRNRRLFGRAFILMESRETRSYVPKGKILTPMTKDGFYIETYSSILDLILTVLPVAISILMGLFEHLGW